MDHLGHPLRPGMGSFTGHRPTRDRPKDRNLDLNHLALLDTPSPKSFSLFSNRLTAMKTGWLRPQAGEPTMVEIEPYSMIGPFDQKSTNTCPCQASAAAYKYAVEREESYEHSELSEAERRRHPLVRSGFVPSRLFLYYAVRAMYEKNFKGKDQEYDENRWLKSLIRNPPTQDINPDSGCDVTDVCIVLCSLGTCHERPIDHSQSPTDSWPFFDTDHEDLKILWGDVANDWSSTYTGVDKDGWPEYTFTNPKSLGRKAPLPKAFVHAERHRTLGYAYPPDTDHVWKKCLENGYALIVDFQVYEDGIVDQANQYIISTPKPISKWVTSHVVIIVGWDDQKGSGGCWLIQDSYGKQQGENGLWWMPYTWGTLKAPNLPKSRDGATMLGSAVILYRQLREGDPDSADDAVEPPGRS